MHFSDSVQESRLTTEEETLFDVILAARCIQEFLWGEMNAVAGLEEFKRMFRKRLAKLEEVTMENPHWRVELKKRLLQTAAIAVNLITKIDNGQLTHEGIHPTLPSNLPAYADPVSARTCRVCGCTDDDCRQCIEAQGHPCWWVEENLCSRCATG